MALRFVSPSHPTLTSMKLFDAALLGDNTPDAWITEAIFEAFEQVGFGVYS